MSNESNPVLDAMILGARRSGTTSLGWYLMEHPEVYHTLHPDFDPIGGIGVNYPYNNPFLFMKPEQEIRETYAAVRPTRPHLAEGVTCRMNRAVYAIYYPHILTSIAEYNPKMKVLISLRNPIECTFSVFSNAIEKRGFKGTFEEFIGCRVDLKTPPRKYKPSEIAGVVGRGVYLPGIKMLMQLFPREQLHVMTFEEHTKNTEISMKKVCDFLNIDSSFQFARLATARGKTQKHPPMHESTREWLMDYYEQYNRPLMKLLGWPLDHWSQ